MNCVYCVYCIRCGYHEYCAYCVSEILPCMLTRPPPGTTCTRTTCRSWSCWTILMTTRLVSYHRGLLEFFVWRYLSSRRYKPCNYPIYLFLYFNLHFVVSHLLPRPPPLLPCIRGRRRGTSARVSPFLSCMSWAPVLHVLYFIHSLTSTFTCPPPFFLHLPRMIGKRNRRRETELPRLRSRR